MTDELEDLLLTFPARVGTFVRHAQSLGMGVSHDTVSVREIGKPRFLVFQKFHPRPYLTIVDLDGGTSHRSWVDRPPEDWLSVVRGKDNPR